tara:strand:- start:153 stop:317 length:165 start_codon:yes stop_codon:yes gene_type:complete
MQHKESINNQSLQRKIDSAIKKIPYELGISNREIFIGNAVEQYIAALKKNRVIR